MNLSRYDCNEDDCGDPAQVLNMWLDGGRSTLTQLVSYMLLCSNCAIDESNNDTRMYKKNPQNLSRGTSSYHTDLYFLQPIKIV